MRRSRLEMLLFDYAAGDLDEDARREVERLLAADPAARALFREVRAAHDALKLMRERPEPPVRVQDVLPSIQAAIAAQAFEPKPQLHLEGWGTRYYRRLAVAATLLCAVTVGYFTLARGGGGEAPPVPPAPPVTASIAHPGIERVVDLGSRREGISAEEFFRLMAEIDGDPGALNVAPVVNAGPVDYGAAQVR